MAEAISSICTAIGLGKETVFGTGVAPTVWFEMINESVTGEFETLTQIDTRGRVERNVISQGRARVSGSFDIHVNAENLGYLVYFILGGTDTITTPVGGTLSRDHTMEIGLCTSPSLTYEADYGEVTTEAKKATGVKLNSLTIEMTDGLVTSSVGVDGREITEDAVATAIVFTDWPRTFDFKDLTFTLDGVDETIDVVSGTLTITSANFTDDYRQNDQFLNSILSGPVSVELTLDMVFDPATVATTQDFLDSTSVDKTIILKYTGDIIEAALNYELEVTLPHCYSENATPVISGVAERVMRSVRIRSLHEYGDPAEDGIKFRFRNKKTTSYSS